MNRSVTASVLTLAIAVALAPGAAAQEHDHDAHHAHDHHHAHDATPAQVPADHVPWPPDQPLIDGMARVRAAVSALAHHEAGHLGAEQVREHAGEVDAAIAYMFANCSLPPEPDAALHAVQARLMVAARALRESPADAAPVAAMRAALDDYGRLFDDPAHRATSTAP